MPGAGREVAGPDGHGVDGRLVGRAGAGMGAAGQQAGQGDLAHAQAAVLEELAAGAVESLRAGGGAVLAVHGPVTPW